jgi:hypothetical protein
LYWAREKRRLAAGEGFDGATDAPTEEESEEAGPEHDAADFLDFGVTSQDVHEQSDYGD